MSVLNEVFCVNLDIRIWSGRKKLTAADLQVSDASLPPKDLATLGNKRICDPDTLKPFHRIEGRARDACLRVGVHFLSGYGVAKSKADELVDSLHKLREEFEKEKQALLGIYDEAVAEWVAAHPGWEHVLKDLVPREEAAAKLSFDFQTFAILDPFASEVEADDPKTNGATQGLDRATQGLPDQLYSEIAVMAREAWKKSFVGKTSVTRKALRPIKAAMVKLELMRFLDPVRIGALLVRINQKLAEMPKSGPIEGNALNAIKGIAYALSDVQRLKMYAEHLEQGLPLDEASLGRTEEIAVELSNASFATDQTDHAVAFEKLEPADAETTLPAVPPDPQSFYW